MEAGMAQGLGFVAVIDRNIWRDIGFYRAHIELHNNGIISFEHHVTKRV